MISGVVEIFEGIHYEDHLEQSYDNILMSAHLQTIIFEDAVSLITFIISL